MFDDKGLSARGFDSAQQTGRTGRAEDGCAQQKNLIVQVDELRI